MHLLTASLELQKFYSNLCRLYENTKRLLQKDSWSIFAPTRFVNLLVIHHLKKFTERKQQDVVANLIREHLSCSKLNQGYLSTNIKDIFKDAGDDGRIILIQGVPGIGKTILCKEIAYRWSCKELLQDDWLLLLVFLRDPAIKDIKSVDSLIRYMYRCTYDDDETRKISNVCAKHLMNTGGSNVTVILDGFDELSHLENQNYFILDLLYKNVLPLCKIVVSSRPAASKDLDKIADVKVEILGFTEENRQIFIKNELKDDSAKLLRLQSYLKENSNIDHLCYIPYILSMLVYVAKQCEELPKSQTELYKLFVFYTISRFLQRDKILTNSISDVNELPSKLRIYFWDICKYAYNALQCKKITFTADEIKTEFPAFADAPGSLSGLGLLKSAEYFSIEENNDCTSYNFLHLSIQEYLAALYITRLNTNQQIDILKKCFFDEKYLNMWIMYGGLSEEPLALMHFLSGKKYFIIMTRLFSIGEISKDIIQSKIKRLYVFQCLSDIKSHRLYDLASRLFEKGILDLSNYTLSPKDIDTLICILERSATTRWNELNLSHCNIRDYGFFELCKALSNFNRSILFNKMNLKDNGLTVDSLEIIVDIIVCCETQVLCLSDNFNIDLHVKLIYLAMEYAFKDQLQKHPLTIHIDNQESVIFNMLDKQLIISLLNVRYWIKGLYFINCKIDDEVFAVLSDIITTHKSLCQLSLWNTCTSRGIMQKILSIMPRDEVSQFLVVFEESSVDVENVTFDFQFDYDKYPLFSFVFVNNFSFLLHGVDDMHIKYIIVYNPIWFLKTDSLTEIQLSNCKLSEHINLLSQLFSQSTLRKCLLLNNQFDFKLLQQLTNVMISLPSLCEIVIEDKSINVTSIDCYTIVDELSKSFSHSIIFFCNNRMRAYRSHDEQLNDIDVISTINQWHNEDKTTDIIVYEKSFFADNTSIHDACKSLPINYILFTKFILLAENVKSNVLLTVLDSSSFQTSNIHEIIFSNCELSNNLVELLPLAFSHCKLLVKFICKNTNLDSAVIKKLIDALPSLKEIIAYGDYFIVHYIYALIHDLYVNKKAISVIIVTNEALMGYNCGNELFSYAVNLNLMITAVCLTCCTISNSTFESMKMISCIKRITVSDSVFSQHFSVSFLSRLTKLEDLCLWNNQLQLEARNIIVGLQKISSLKVLTFQHSKISEELAGDLAAAIKANSSLEKLWLNGNYLGELAVVVIKALREISALNELYLCNNVSRHKEKALVLASAVASNKSMEKLLLKNNNLHDDGVIKIANSVYKYSEKLKVFDLQNNNITEKAAKVLGSAISNSKGLKELYLGNNQLQSGVIKLADGLKNISSLQVLDLQNNKIPEEAAGDLAAAINANHSLEILWLNGNHLGSSLVAIVHALIGNSALKQLNLNGNENSSKELALQIAHLLVKNKAMEKLLLSKNNLNNDGAINIAQSLCKHSKLITLDLRNNNITEEAAEALASVISKNRGLQELYLGNNQIESRILNVATALKTVSSLQVLDLQNNNIPEESAGCLEAAITANRSLQKILLSGNYLGLSTVAVVSALKKLSMLKELHLSNNNRNIVLGSTLASVIRSNKFMETLVLNNNGLNDNGLIRITQSLCRHSTLKVFDLQNNNITEESAEALASVISSNNRLEKLNLSNSQLQLGLLKVAAAMTNISSLKFLDLQNNSITEQGAKVLSAAIRVNCSIEQLFLANNYIFSSMAVIGKACCQISSLKVLEVMNTGIIEAFANDLAAVIRCNTSIQFLSISENNLQSSGFMIIIQALKVISNLKYLYANDINITSVVSKDLSSVIKHNVLMERISLSENLLENGLIQITESCSRLAFLTALELSHNSISPTKVINLALIASKCNSLKSLSLGGICMSAQEYIHLSVSEIFCKVFCKSIRNNFTFKKYHIMDNKFLFISEHLRKRMYTVSILNYDQLIVAYQKYWYDYISYQHKDKFSQNTWSKIVFDLIKENSKQKLSQIDSKTMMSSLHIIRTLKVINLESNNIDGDAAKELADHLDHNNTLEQLWLRGNELYDKGASVVLQSLHNLSTLLILDLSFNHLSSESADGIAVVISNNCSLQQLWLDGNDLLTRGVVVIASALKKLSSLRILSLCSNEKLMMQLNRYLILTLAMFY